MPRPVEKGWVEDQEEEVSLCSAQVAAQQQESASTQKAEREVSRMVVVMVGSFCVCYTPYAAMAMYMVNNRNHGLDLRLVTIPAFFSKSACVYNPIIYCFMNKQVKLSIYISRRLIYDTWFFSHQWLLIQGTLDSTQKVSRGEQGKLLVSIGRKVWP